MDLAKLLIQCFSLIVVQGAITGLYGQFASSVYEVSDYGEAAFSGKDKIVACLNIADRLVHGTDADLS